MSTRCYIGIDENPIRYIYCHYDGYLDHVGRILQDHYSEEKKASALIGLGNVQNISGELDDVICFGENYSFFHEGHIKFLNTSIGINYIYLFKDGQWLVNAWAWELDKDYILLKDAIGCCELH